MTASHCKSRLVASCQADLGANHFEGLGYSDRDDTRHKGRNEGGFGVELGPEDVVLDVTVSVVVEEGIEAFPGHGGPQTSDVLFHGTNHNSLKFLENGTRCHTFDSGLEEGERGLKDHGSEFGGDGAH